MHWTKPRRFLRYAEVHAYLSRLRDGRLLAVYTNYHVPFGVFAVLSADNGTSWDLDHVVQLSHSLDMYTGWPTSIELEDGSILTSYAASVYREKQANGQMSGGTNTAFEVINWSLP